MATKLSYKDAGLDLDVYNETMGKIAPLLEGTFTDRVIRQKNGFAGLFSLDFPQNWLFARLYRRPVLVAGTDGVGTKLKVAAMAGRHTTVGIDLVAMCVNDCLCVGAEPLFFLDYVAMGKDNPELTLALVEGISEGCKRGGMALIGGETAIMPDLYQSDDYDMAGFCVGVVERRKLVEGPELVEQGDIVLGVESSGFHSNGYSLIRKAVFEVGGLDIDSHVPELSMTVADALLKPTMIYSQLIREILGHYRVKRVIRGIAHITGGGIEENLNRVLPGHLDAVIERKSWEVPPVFGWVQRLGDIDPAEMYRVFNMGIGMAIVVRPYYADRVRELIEDKCDVRCHQLGDVQVGNGKVRLV